jgi:uncharacterized protein YcbK (DUF882 family)
VGKGLDRTRTSSGSIVAVHFSDDEIRGLDPRLVEALDHARGFAGLPFIITSGLRTPEENANAGGVDNSEHMRGLGVDLACSSSHARMRMVTALILAGFRRIGIYDKHLHAGLDESLPLDVMWLGVSH